MEVSRPNVVSEPEGNNNNGDSVYTHQHLINHIIADCALFDVHQLELLLAVSTNIIIIIQWSLR